MRFLPPAAAAVMIAACGLLILVAGERIAPEAAWAPGSVSGKAENPATAAVARPDPPRPDRLGRSVAPETAAPPSDPGGFERVEPREALSRLGLALPPKPLMPGDWKGTILYRPIAAASGLVEAMGHQVAIAGIEIVEADETCSFEGKSWACGVRARTAFRSWLRGRAITCAVPPQAEREIIVAACRVGKQDVGNWLAANGWARAAKGGGYAEAEQKARAAKKGIFGPPPDRSSLPPPPSAAIRPPMPPIDPTAPFE